MYFLSFSNRTAFFKFHFLISVVKLNDLILDVMFYSESILFLLYDNKKKKFSEILVNLIILLLRHF